VHKREPGGVALGALLVQQPLFPHLGAQVSWVDLLGASHWPVVACLRVWLPEGRLVLRGGSRCCRAELNRFLLDFLRGDIDGGYGSRDSPPAPCSSHMSS
jgi:hypothetical protein